MKLIRRLLVLGAALAVALMAFAPAAHADPIIYSFSGAALNFANVPPCCTNPWGASNPISGYLELSAELPTNAAYFNNNSPMTAPFGLNQLYGAVSPVNLLGYSFTDGITTFTGSNSTLGTLDLQTGSTTIDYWSIDLDANPIGGFAAHLQVDNEGNGTFAYEKDSDGIAVEDIDSTGGYGSFSQPEPELTPEPATWTLFGTGALALLGVAVLAEHRRRLAAAV